MADAFSPGDIVSAESVNTHMYVWGRSESPTGGTIDGVPIETYRCCWMTSSFHQVTAYFPVDELKRCRPFLTIEEPIYDPDPPRMPMAA